MSDLALVTRPCTHRRVVCLCGQVVAACRCKNAKPNNETVASCRVCDTHRILGETPRDQRERIQVELSKIINEFGGDNMLCGVSVFNWLVDARIEIENLKRELKREQSAAI